MTAPRIGAVVLAAGASTRMGAELKLLAELAGRPVIDSVLSTALRSRAEPVVVVVGHSASAVRDRIPPGCVVVENPGYERGLSSSLATGIEALPADVEGAVILLGDMPFVEARDVDALLSAFDPTAPCAPLVDGRRANPVLWPRAFFPRILGLEGDRGARGILEAEGNRVVEVPVDNQGLLFDIDTPEDLDRARAST